PCTAQAAPATGCDPPSSPGFAPAAPDRTGFPGCSSRHLYLCLRGLQVPGFPLQVPAFNLLDDGFDPSDLGPGHGPGVLQLEVGQPPQPLLVSEQPDHQLEVVDGHPQLLLTVPEQPDGALPVEVPDELQPGREVRVVADRYADH